MPGDAVAPQRIIVTRPALDADGWVRQLQHNGFAAEALPLITIAAASDAADVQAVVQVWQDIASYAACMFVSGNAVRFFFEQKKALAQHLPALSAINNIALRDTEPLPVHLRFMAPGPGTAAALLAAGVPSEQIDAPPPHASQFDSEALWGVVGQRDWRGRRVLVVRGAAGQPDQAGAQTPADSAGRDWMTQQWQAAGAEVEFVGVYQRRAPIFTPAQVQRAQLASTDGSVWLFSSSEALRHLTDMPALHAVDWSRAVAIATHPRIAHSVRAARWGMVVQSRPALADILNTLGSIAPKNPV